MLKRLLPREHHFYDYFEQAANHSVSAARLLLKMTENYQDADPLSRELSSLEHACDEVAHRALDQLAKTFITPLDREDIHAIVLSIDDVVDLINGAANRMTFFQIGKPTVHSIHMAKQIVRGCEKMADAVHAMRSPKTYDRVRVNCIAVHEVENAADDILHEALRDLFATEKDAIAVIKWKDVYEMMELVTDRCEDVANVLQNVIVKMS